MEGLQEFLIEWYCSEHKVTRQDDILLGMTLEELTVQYMAHCIKIDNEYYDRIMHDGEDDYERWLKEEMGEEYQTTKENEDMMKQEKLQFSDKIREQFPDEIKTNFEEILKGE